MPPARGWEGRGSPGPSVCLCPMAAEAVQKAVDFTASSGKRLRFSSRSPRRERDRLAEDGKRACGQSGVPGSPIAGPPQRAGVVCFLPWL